VVKRRASPQLGVEILSDIQILAAHSALGTTQRYIEASEEAKRRVVELV